MVSEEMKNEHGCNFIGNVIRIIDNRTILVNAGKDELEVGNIVQIYELGEKIKDIDGRELCNYEFVKDELEVIRAEKLYSVCRKMKSVSKTYKAFGFSLSPLLEHTETEYIPLRVEESDIQEMKKPKDSLVRVGDPIKLAWQTKKMMVR